MAPLGVGVGELLALGSVLGQEPLTVGVSREIRPVDSHVAAHLGQALVQRGDTVEAVRQRIRVPADVDAYLAVASKRKRREYAESPVPEDAVSRILDAGRIAGGAKNPQPSRFRFAGRNAQELAVWT
jgi:hypothetical protein